MAPPFVWFRWRLWVVANWDSRMPEDAWLLLRPATEEERTNYLARIGDAEEEAYWTSVVVDEDRLRSSRGQQQREAS